MEGAFLENEAAIMGGTFSESLIDSTSLNGAVRTAKSLVAERVFEWDRTIAAEIAGVEMITTVLQKTMDAVVSDPSKAGTQLARRRIPDPAKCVRVFFVQMPG